MREQIGVRKEVYEKRRVIWIGANPHGNHERFRIVDCGPPRPGTNDAQFNFEQAKGVDAMGVGAWTSVSFESRPAAIAVLMKALGEYLVHLPISFTDGHILACELNAGIAEGRPSRGCDCKFPADPEQRE